MAFILGPRGMRNAAQSQRNWAPARTQPVTATSRDQIIRSELITPTDTTPPTLVMELAGA